MLPASFKAKVQKLLMDSKFKKSAKTKSRIRGLQNCTDGFVFEKVEDAYYLYFTCGNMINRGMLQESQDHRTETMYKFLIDQGLGDHVEITRLRVKKAILLKP